MTYAMTAPVDGARVRALLEGYGLSVGQLREELFQFLLREDAPEVPDLLLRVNASGALLQMTGERPVRHDAEHAAWVLTLVSAYQRTHCWPAGFLSWADGGAPCFSVVGEVDIHVGEGASDEQLDAWMRVAAADLGSFTRRVHHALAERERPGGVEALFDLEAWLEV